MKTPTPTPKAATVAKILLFWHCQRYPMQYLVSLAWITDRARPRKATQLAAALKLSPTTAHAHLEWLRQHKFLQMALAQSQKAGGLGATCPTKFYEPTDLTLSVLTGTQHQT